MRDMPAHVVSREVVNAAYSARRRGSRLVAMAFITSVCLKGSTANALELSDIVGTWNSDSTYENIAIDSNGDILDYRLGQGRIGSTIDNAGNFVIVYRGDARCYFQATLVDKDHLRLASRNGSNASPQCVFGAFTRVGAIHALAEKIRKSAGFGGNGGGAFDDSDANPDRLPLSKITVHVSANPQNRTQLLIGFLQVEWGNGRIVGPAHGLGPVDVATPTIQFSLGELVSEVQISDASYEYKDQNTSVPPHWISGLRIITNKSTYSYGYLYEGSINRCVAGRDETIIGFFGRSGAYIDQLGCVFMQRR